MGTSKTVLYLSYDGMTDPLGQSQVLPYLKGLAKHGYTIHLVSHEKMTKFNKGKAHIHNICNSAGILWHPQDYTTGSSILQTWRQIKKMKKISIYLHEKHNFSIVHCRSYIAALSGINLKRKKGVKFIFDMRGFWADERIDGKIWNLKNPLYRLIYYYFKKKERQFFREADHTISLTSNGKQEIKSWKYFKQDPPKIKVIPCCVDLDLFDPLKISEEEKSEQRKKLGIRSNDYILGYVGSIGTWYMLSEMLDYFKVLKTKQPHARFLFVSGENPESIIEQAEEKNINKEDLIITSALHYQVPLNISLFDRSIFFILPAYSKKASSPTKQGEIMAMGIPLVCNSGVGDTDAIVREYNSGLVIDEFTEAEYLNAISNTIQFDPNNITRGAREYFSLEEGVNRYLSIYQSCV